MNELINWLLVFMRVSAMLAVFPIFSAANFPVQLRLALGALMAVLVSPTLPALAVQPGDFIGWVGLMAVEVGAGLAFGFASRMIFFALDMAGAIIGQEIGLSLPPSLNPMSGAQTQAPGTVLYYLAAMIWLSLDLHHWMLVGFQKTYFYLPVGGVHLPEIFMTNIIGRTSETFVIALQLAAPVMAVSFIVSLVFAVLGRAVPQMNVFHESFTIRTLAGLGVFGLSLQLMSQHISNYLRRLPEDVLSVAQLLSSS
ncbi:MAG: fliR [Pedosphaera sp.]|nr:fliR [Pedosphaera sp.]